MKRLFVFIILALVVAVMPLEADDTLVAPAPVVEHTHKSDLGVLTNMKLLAPGMLAISSVAYGATDWDFTGPISGRQYHVSAKQQALLTGGIIGGSLGLCHVWKKSCKFTTAFQLIVSGYYAGRAYANEIYRRRPPETGAIVLAAP